MLFQLGIETRGRLARFTAPHQIRPALHTLRRVLGSRALLFGLVADHGHVVVDVEDRAAAGHAGSALNRAWSALGADLLPTHVSAVEDARHLATLPGCLARQAAKHPVAPDPAAHEGTCLHDLVGARVGCLDLAAIGAALPQIDLAATALAAVGLRGPVVPATDAEVAALGARPVWDAMATAFALLAVDRSEAARRAYAAYVEVGRAAELGIAELRAAPGWSPDAWQRIKDVPAPDADVLALRTQLGLRALLARHPPATRVVPETTPRAVKRRV